jgi:hypothetical protein
MDFRCSYPSKLCENPRAVRRNGQLHSFCEEHRQKANDAQKRWYARRRKVQAIPYSTTTATANSHSVTTTTTGVEHAAYPPDTYRYPRPSARLPDEYDEWRSYNQAMYPYYPTPSAPATVATTFRPKTTGVDDSRFVPPHDYQWGYDSNHRNSDSGDELEYF